MESEARAASIEPMPGRTVVVLLLSWASVAGCAYDWSVATQKEAGAGPRDAGVDRRIPADAEDHEALDDAQCNTLIDELANDMSDIERCDASCGAHVPGFCDCEIAVETAEGSAVSRYRSLLAELGDSGCIDCSIFQCNPVKFTCNGGICR
jgi:hypothetical protein